MNDCYHCFTGWLDGIGEATVRLFATKGAAVTVAEDVMSMVSAVREHFVPGCRGVLRCQDVARAAAWLCSDEAAFVTGDLIRVS